jgi:Ca-activated chloride channel family protein
MTITGAVTNGAGLQRCMRAGILLLAVAVVATTVGPVRADEEERTAARPEPYREVGDLGPPIDPAAIGSGTLLLRGPEGLHPLPLAEGRVEIVVTGIMARGTVTQVFRNPTAEVIEAVYLFPLPDRAAVNHMEMHIGERHIVSLVEERKEARRTYEQARQEGRKAGLVEQSRPNLFTTSVANVNPGESVTVILEYLEEVGWQDGEFSLVFPMAFTPRYFPGDGETDGLDPARASCSPGDVGRERRARVRVELRTGVSLEEVECTSHTVPIRHDSGVWILEPEGGTLSADRDLRVRWRPAVGDLPEAALVTERREDGRYAMLMVFPPDLDDQPDVGLPTETLFIVDVSGSMDGPSIRQARAALLAALDELRPEDTFNLLKFSSTHEAFREAPANADDENLHAARGWVRSLEAGGGTEILPALRAGVSMAARGSPDRARRILFLTDGAVGNEAAVFDLLAQGLGDVRLHTLGIGHAPNAWLMRKMAALGRGACSFVHDTSGAENLIAAFFAKLRRPVMTELELGGLGLELSETYPSRLTDLHSGEPLVVSFRLDDGVEKGRISLSGRTHWGWLQRELAVEPIESPSGRGLGVATRWARARVADLMDSLHEGADEQRVREDVVALAKAFHLVTRYTSLVAVEKVATAEGPAGRTLRDSARLGLGALPRGGTLDPLKKLLGGLLSLLGAMALVPYLLGRSR